MAAVKDSVNETRRRGEQLAFTLRQLVEIAPQPPCNTCRIDPAGECVLHRRLRAAQGALADWESRK